MKLRATVYQAMLIINQKLTQFSFLALPAMATIRATRQNTEAAEQLQLQAIDRQLTNPNRRANMKSCADKSALQVVNQSGSPVVQGIH